MTSIAKRYQIISELGSGGMGTVYKAEDTLAKQVVAIKRLKPGMTTPELIERFQREGEALRDLNHPNIVKMLGAIEQDETHYLVMEYVSGGDLSDLLKNGELPIERCLELALDLSDALTRAHKLNIIHRDLKPANVLIADDSTLRLTDFGVAHIGNKHRVTVTDAIIGTVDYLAPESLDGSEIDPRADIWAFGVILFEMLTGEPPFKGESIAQSLIAIINQPTPDLETLRPDAPLALIDLIYRMLEKDRNVRIRSVRQVGLELEDILHGRTQQTPPETRFAADTPNLLRRPKHNLPAQTTPFVGREDELQEVAKLIDNPNIRLVTITAPGGMGKTRLALEAAERQVANFENGAYLVELAPLSDPVHIVPAIASATGYQFQSDGREQKQQILDFLSNKYLLLVMDNYEHLLGGAALLSDMLQAAPHVSILATSRQRLNLSGETVFNLHGMDFPAWETPADALEYAAVKLFMLGAKRTQPDFELTADNMDGVARTCKLVNGLPLAILLAASWVAMLAPQEIAAEIAQSMDFLASDMPDVPERHRSVRAVFDYSWNLMTVAEQQVLMRLSVFRGGFTREAAQAVTGAALHTLMSLINKSLMQRDIESGRYAIHDLLRQYGSERLLESGQYDELVIRHSQYYCDFVNDWFKGDGVLMSKNTVAVIGQDYENIRAALQHAIDHRDENALEKGIKLTGYFQLLGTFRDTEPMFKAALAVVSPENRALRGRLTVLLMIAAHLRNDIPEAYQYVQASTTLLDAIDDPESLIGGRFMHSYILRATQGFEGWATELEQILVLAQESKQIVWEQTIHGFLDYFNQLRGDAESGETVRRKLIKQMREMDSSYGPLTYILASEAVAFMWKDDFENAHAHLREALDYATQVVMVQGVIDIHSLQAITAFLQADYAAAQGYVDAARAFAQQMNVQEERMMDVSATAIRLLLKQQETDTAKRQLRALLALKPQEMPFPGFALIAAAEWLLYTQRPAYAVHLLRLSVKGLVPLSVRKSVHVLLNELGDMSIPPDIASLSIGDMITTLEQALSQQR